MNFSSTKRQASRLLSFESLEERRVLSANGLEDPTADSGFVTTEFEDQDLNLIQQDVITSVKVAVNGDVRELTANSNRLDLVPGDVVEVVEIGFDTIESSGVFAAEGYLNKINDLASASLIDYDDGRFSARESNFDANGQSGAVKGLDNGWTVESGWDRLTINLMHYQEDSVSVSGRFFAQLQVGRPDFAFDTQVLEQVRDVTITEGDEVTLPAKWFNQTYGNFHNYAEVDIYHESDLDKIVWAGAAVGNASADHSISGEFTNTREGDPFSQRWSPDAPGEYVLKYYIDPEGIVAESNEDNNEYEIRLVVEPLIPFQANDDVADFNDAIDVLENDITKDDSFNLFNEDFETDESVLRWTTNPQGTDTATSGLWEITEPVGTSWNGVELQLSAGEGTRALVTGGSDDGSVGGNDVDGGLTSAISETMLVPDRAAIISFQYNFAHLSNSTAEDYFRVSIVSGNESSPLLEIQGANSERSGQWTQFFADISQHAGQEIQILVEVADQGGGSLVEAGIDRVMIDVPESVHIHEFTQGTNGTVSLQPDGTFAYQPNDGFVGQDQFQYSLTDGELVSNTATVTVYAEGKHFHVETEVIGEEDTALPLLIETEYEQVQIAGVPADVSLNRGSEISPGIYLVDQNQILDLNVTPKANSDVDFALTVTPVENGVPVGSLAETVSVNVLAVVDGGSVEFGDFAIQTGNSGRVPVTASFVDLDGSESHSITLTGLPEFMELSAGTKSGDNWILAPEDLPNLTVNSERAENTSDWASYFGFYRYKSFDVNLVTESVEIDGFEPLLVEDQFTIQVWQRV